MKETVFETKDKLSFDPNQIGRELGSGAEGTVYTYERGKVIKLMHSLHDDFWVLPGFPTVSRPFQSTSRSSGHNPSRRLAVKSAAVDLR